MCESVLAAWLVLGTAAQVPGHDTLPTAGPATRDARASARGQEDAVLVQVERLRRDLDRLARRYRKLAPAERDARKREWLPVLEEMVERAKSLEESRPGRRP